MKIIGGAKRGLALAAPKGLETRPTAARAREALFNRLDHAFLRADGRPLYQDRVVIDACCGAGAMALEALSRGAARAVLIDSAPAALSAARRNADAAGYADRCRFVRGDATTALIDDIAQVVFIDPPYRLDAAPFLARFAERLTPDGLIALETAAKTTPESPPALRLIDDRRYGAARLSLRAHGNCRKPVTPRRFSARRVHRKLRMDSLRQRESPHCHRDETHMAHLSRALGGDGRSGGGVRDATLHGRRLHAVARR